MAWPNSISTAGVPQPDDKQTGKKMEGHDDGEWRTSRYDPRIPLGMPRVARPEFGETVREYYARKYATQKPGKYYGLHLVALALPWRQ
jgi:hypothetical protein